MSSFYILKNIALNGCNVLLKFPASLKLRNLFVPDSRLAFVFLPLFFILISQSSLMGNCTTCTGNLITNGTFNSNVNNWFSYNGNFFRSTAFPQCSSSGHAELVHSTGWAGFYQDLTSLSVGATYKLTFWAGVHNNSANTLFGVEFFNGSTYLSEATLQIDKILGGTPSMQFYTIIFTVPSNTNKVRVIGKMNSDYIKVDEVCLTPDNSTTIENPCGSGVTITTHAAGTNNNCSGNPDISITVPSSSQVTSMVAEVVYKNEDPGASVTVTTTSPSASHTLYRVFVPGSSPNVYVYRGAISGSAGAVRVNSISSNCTTNQGLQSLVVYAYRNISSNIAQYGKFTSNSGYCDLKTFSISIPTSASARDLTITVPISELTTDNRYLRVRATAGSATNSVVIYGPDASLNSCCVNVVTLNLSNVPGSATSVNFEIDTRNTTNPGSPAASGCGQSWVLASLVNVNIDCGVTNPCINFTALAQSELNLVKTRTISNEITCVSQPDRVLWLDCVLDNSPGGTSGNLKFWRIISGGTFKEYCDGTAHFNMRVQNVVNSNYKFDVSVILTGRTFSTPSGSPHLEGCTSSASSNWYYYTGMKGSLIGVDGLSGGNLSFDRKGGSFQIGTNASLFGTSGSFGASGWIMYSVLSNPTAFNFKHNCAADFNFFLSGGNLTSTEAASCQTICAGASVDLNGYAVGGKPNYTYNWSHSLGSGQNKTVTPTSTTTYTVTITDANNCTATDAVTITVSPKPNVNAGVDAAICPGQSLIITASATSGTSPYTYSWNNGLGNGASKTVNPASTTTYIVTVTDSKGCTATDDIVVTVGGNINLTATGAEICLGTTGQISATASGGQTPYTYSWSDALGNGATKNVSPTATKTYTVTATDSNGCSKTATATVIVNPKPTISANAPDVCAGSTLNITSTPSGGTPGYSYTWSGPSSFAASTQNISRPNATTAMSGTYSVTVTDSKGCTGTTSVNALVKPAPTVDIGPDKTICTGDELVINSTVTGIPNCGTPGTYRCENPIANSGGYITNLSTAAICGDNAGAKLWTQGGQGTSFITLDMGSNVPSGTQICVRVKLEHCSNTSSSVADMRILTSTSATTGFTNVIASRTFSHTSYQTYCYTLTNSVRYVRVQDNGKCSMRLDYLEYTTPNTFNNSITYSWSGPGIIGSASGTSITVNQSGTYVLSVTDCTGCVATDDVVINIHNNVQANVDDAEICAGQSVTLTANTVAGATYEWTEAGNNTVISTAQSITVSPTSTTSYIVTIRVNGCEDSDDATVIVHPNPVLNLSASPQFICYGTSTTITASASGGTAPYTFIWNQGLGSGSEKTVNPTTNTTYAVTVTDSKGCTATGSITITVNPELNLTVNDAQICVGASAQLTASTSGGQAPYAYSWSNGLGSGAVKNVSPLLTTTYLVTVTDASGCTKTANATVTILERPVASAVNNGPVTCAKPTVILTASPASGVTYLWSNLATTQTINVSSAGTYTVTVTSLSNGCTSTASTTVVEDLQPPVANAGADVTVNCFNPSATLTATGGGTYLWSTGETTASITVNPELTTTYTVTVTANNGCTDTDAVQVTANKAKPSASISATGNNCITQNAQLFGNANGGTGPYTYNWSGPNGFNSQLQNPFITDNGTYILTVTDVNGCTDTESIVIFSEFIPVVVVVTTEICKGETVTLNASGGVSYQWDANANNATTASVQVSPLVTTTYIVTVTSANGCVSTASVLITVYDNPVINSLDVIQNTSCNNQNNTGSITVNATGHPGLTLQYRINGGTWQLSNFFGNLGNGIYNVEVSYTTRLCLSLPAQTTIFSQPNLVLVAEDDKTVCPNTTFTLTANANGGTPPYTYLWSNTSTGATITVNGGISNATTFIVTVTDNKGCTATDDVLVSIIPPPVTSISGPDQVCVDEFAIFSVNPPIPGATYFWNFNGGFSADNDNDDPVESVKWPSVFQNSFRTISVTITKDGCPTTFTKQVFVKQGVFLNTPGLYDVCQGGSVTIGPNPNDPNQVSPGATFLWTPNLFLNSNTVAQPVATPPFDITYTLTATINGCVETRQVTVNVDVNLNPIADAGPDNTICLGSSVTIGGNPTATPPVGGAIAGVVWIPAAGLNNPLLHNPTASPAATTDYMVVVVATSGCADTAFTKVTVLPRPSITATASPGTICQGQPSQLSANASGGTAPYTFNWSNGLGQGQNKNVSPISTTTYSVTVTDANGCTASTSVLVTVNPTPSVILNVNPGEICLGSSATLTANGTGGTLPYTFTWSNNFNGGNSQQVSPVSTTTYSVTITDGNGCTAISSASVIVNPNPSVQLNAVPVEICASSSTTINATPSGGTAPYTILWSNGLGSGLSKTVSPIVSTTYSVTVTDAKGCTSTNSINIGVNPLPQVSVNASPSVICRGASTQITATGSGGTSPYTYAWSNGLGSGASKNVSPIISTTYIVTVTDSKGCTATNSVTVTVEQLAKIGDFVWDDINVNGLQDIGEPGLAGVQVSIYLASNDQLIDVTTTNAAGNYEFEVCPGTYYIIFGSVAGYERTQKDAGDDALDSDADSVTGKTGNYTVTSGQVNPTVDAGYIRELNIELRKTFVNAVPQANGSFNVTYTVSVINSGRQTLYDLKDTPLFDDDITINSASFVSNAPGNAGGPLAGSGPWSLADDVLILYNTIHIYTLTVNVSLNLNDNGGDNTYTKCGQGTQTSVPGQGLFNKAGLDLNNDGIPEFEAFDCGDIPNVIMRKDLVNVIQNANGSSIVNYAIIVNNNGGATGQYSLKDTPLFDDDVTILSGSYSGQANGNMNIAGSTQLANNVSIAAGNTHTYNVSFVVTLNLEPGSGDGGDNIYTPCAVVGNGPGSSAGQGLYNKAELDRNGDGITDITDDACGDLPYIIMRKDLVSVSQSGNGHRVIYTITVQNVGGASGNYTLTDSPLFDDDITITAWDYTFVDLGLGIGNGPAFIGSPPVPINFGTSTLTAGNTHIYTLGFDVVLNLEQNSVDGGDNIYTPCTVQGSNSGSSPGQGLYNRADLDRTGDGIPDISDDACGDLPYVKMRKDIVNVVTNANGTYTVNYAIIVNNLGGATGQYSLKDTPLFDDDVTILSGSYSGQAMGVMNLNGSTQLATNVSINAGASHTYNVSFNVTLNLELNSTDGGDNIYTPCALPGNGPGSGPGQGLYNRAELDRNGDGMTDITDDACGDLPYINMRKDIINITPNFNGTFTVNYAIIVSNTGGVTGQYSLKDTPLFDDDVTILSGSYSGQSNGIMNTSGPTQLATNIAINAGASHIYNVTFNVVLNLNEDSNDAGDNIYTPCSIPGNGPGSNPGQGLYNLAELDWTGDGNTDIADDACGDLPFVTMVKNFVSVVPGVNNTYTVTYDIIVNNIGGATGNYSLKDTPKFDDDVIIISGNFSGQANGIMNIAGSTILAGNTPIASGATHVYNVSFVVRLDISPQSEDGGDNVYTPCAVSGNGPGSSAGQGLYNLAELDRTGDGITDVIDDACGDLPGAIGDFVWDDLNADGIQDVGEPGIRNVLVRLLNQSGSVIRTTLTDVNGYYLFSNLNPGIYSVQFVSPGGYFPTLDNRGVDDARDSDANPLTGVTGQYTLAPGQVILTVDAGFYRLARLGDFVWEDRNANGIQDPLEPGIPNVQVILNGTDARGLPVNLNTTTNGMGMYEFNNLVPGNYTVTFVRPGSQYLSSPPNVGLNDQIDSDADPITGTTGNITLLSGDNNTTVDAGFYRCAKVGDFVWLDTGILENVQDAGDTGLNNIPVELYSTSNPSVPLASQLTRNSPVDGRAGYYLFDCVPPGEYFIRVRKPNEYDFVVPNFGIDDMIDSDIVDFINERTLNFTVSYAQVILDIDIGFKFKVLPVEIISFDGKWNRAKDVNELNWTTASEINNDFFEVQRSFGGKEFETIGKVKGSGNAGSRIDYQFDDFDISTNGVYSYRLKQVDFDGKFTYSHIVDVLVGRQKENAVRIYPNPANSYVNINLSAYEGAKVELDVYDNTGRMIINHAINAVLQSDVLDTILNLDQLKPGVYVLNIKIDTEVMNHRLIIIR